MSDKLSLREEERMGSAISSVLRDIGKGRSPEAAVASVSKENKFTPAQVSRVCEVCNKLSSIKYLSTADDKAKGKAFPLANPKKVMEILNNENIAETNPVKIRKTASDDIPKTSVRKTMMKALGMDSLDRASIVAVDLVNRGQMLQQDMEMAVGKYAHAVSDSKIAVADMEKAFAELLVTAEKSSKEATDDLASYLYHGSERHRKLLLTLAEYVPNYKEASDVRLTKTFVPTNSKLEQLTEKFFLAAKKAAEIDNIKEAKENIALDIANLGLNLAALKEPAEQKETKVDSDNIPISASTVNRLNELSLKDTFANMYLDDPFLRQYEPSEVLDAYNIVLQMAPSLHRMRNADALITSMVKKVITSGNQIDPLELSGLAKMESDTATARYRHEGSLL